MTNINNINDEIIIEMPELIIKPYFKKTDKKDKSLSYSNFSNEKMTFGEALEKCKKGFKIARFGWNGKGMALAYMEGYPNGIPANQNIAKAWNLKENTPVRIQPYLMIRGVDGTYQMWVASHEDLLAEDWYITQ